MSFSLVCEEVTLTHQAALPPNLNPADPFFVLFDLDFDKTRTLHFQPLLTDKFNLSDTIRRNDLMAHNVAAQRAARAARRAMVAPSAAPGSISRWQMGMVVRRPLLRSDSVGLDAALSIVIHTRVSRFET